MRTSHQMTWAAIILIASGWTAAPAQESVIFHDDFTAGGTSIGQMPSFPGAEGFGGSFAGEMPAAGWFSGGSVYHVTTVEDLVDSSGRPLQGTLRGGFWNYANPSQPKQNASNRIVVFDVGGVFQLTQGSLDIKNVDGIYVAGQTAPTPVTVYGNTTQITKSSNTVTQNVVLRYMTCREGSGDGPHYPIAGAPGCERVANSGDRKASATPARRAATSSAAVCADAVSAP